MSAFLVSMLTINQIVAAISAQLNPVQASWLARQFAAAGIDTTLDDWEKRLATAMYALNEQALSQRYGERATGGFIYSRALSLPNQYQILKSIDCWIYQCSEGNVPESKLYQLIDTVVRYQWLRNIVDSSPEYQNAKWE